VAKNKVRADELVHAKGFCESRTRAQALILAGRVRFRKSPEDRWETVAKVGQSLPDDVEFEVDDPNRQDVGRGAQKLRGALDHWRDLDVKGAWALDIGASTGGFTQVLLERGAERVLALDVGRHQLHERLRADPRVISVEEQHVLRIEPPFWEERVGRSPPFGVIVTDVSFISATKLVGVVADWLAPGAPWILLVKPQFELEARKVPHGIVRTEEHRQEALAKVRGAVEADGRLVWDAIIESPIQGGDGNVEYLARIRRKA